MLARAPKAGNAAATSFSAGFTAFADFANRVTSIYIADFALLVRTHFCKVKHKLLSYNNDDFSR